MNRRTFFGALAKGVAAVVGGAKALPHLLRQSGPGVIHYKANTIGVIPQLWRMVPSSEIDLYTDSEGARMWRELFRSYEQTRISSNADLGRGLHDSPRGRSGVAADAIRVTPEAVGLLATDGEVLDLRGLEVRTRTPECDPGDYLARHRCQGGAHPPAGQSLGVRAGLPLLPPVREDRDHAPFFCQNHRGDCA